MQNRFTLLVTFLCLAACTSYGQYVPPNIDFETGTLSNWLFYTGTCCPIVTTAVSGPVATRHTLTSGTAPDPYGGFPVVMPGGGNYCMRLGNIAGGADAEKTRYYIHIPPTMASYQLIYRYATVMEDPGHTAFAQPRMNVIAFDSATGATLPCDSFCYVAGALFPGSIRSTVAGPSGDPVYYIPWKAGNFKFNGLGGHTVVIDFATGDCAYSGHGAYAYVDMTAGLFATTMYLPCASSFTLQGPAGYAGYRWCDSATYGTTYGTSQNVTMTAPTSPTTYAIILTPYSGFGCPDTLYTHVIPPTLCSGTPPPGIATAYRATVCGDPDTLKVGGYASYCGLSIQWQSSPDGTTWANISGFTSETISYYNPYVALYYRCGATCIASGITTYSTSVFVPAVIGPGLHTVIDPPDTACRGANFYVSTCGASVAYNVTTWYGDGTFDNQLLTTTGVRYANFRHNYGFPGMYSVKQILYDGTLAVDSTTFSYHYVYCSTLPVSFYYDENSNCAYDSAETNFFPIRIAVDSNGVVIDTVSATSGIYYHTSGAPGTVYGFRPLPGHYGLVTSCLPTAVYDTIVPYVNLYATKNVGLIYPSGGSSFDLEVHASVRCGSHASAGTILVGNGLPIPTIATLEMDISPRFSFITHSSAPAASIISGSSIFWNLPPFSCSTAPQVFSYWLEHSSGGYTLGDTINTTYSLSPLSGDADIANNFIFRNDTGKSGFDPNYIDVAPQGYISSGTQLEYTIVFENTGNDTAFNIHIMDTLSNLEDVHSLRMVAASAEMNTALFNVGGLNIIKFDFPHINLLDSSHHGQCDGMFVFDINSLPGLARGTIIPNRAGIYFDDNAVVMTNIVNNIIGPPPVTLNINTEQKTRVGLYPNPASDKLVISMDEDAYNSLVITDEVGVQVTSSPMQGKGGAVDISGLPAGVYYATFNGNNGRVVRKFVKM